MLLNARFLAAPVVWCAVTVSATIAVLPLLLSVPLPVLASLLLRVLLQLAPSCAAVAAVCVVGSRVPSQLRLVSSHLFSSETGMFGSDCYGVVPPEWPEALLRNLHKLAPSRLVWRTFL